MTAVPVTTGMLAASCLLALSVPGFRRPAAPPAEPAPVPAIPARNPDGQVQEAVSRLASLPRAMGNRSRRGDLLTLAALSAGIVAGVAALFVLLPVPVLALLSALSLSLLYLAVSALRYRSRAAPQACPERPVLPVAEDDPVPAACTIPAPGGLPPGTLGRYWIQPPHVYVTIGRAGDHGFAYTVTEPAITPTEQVVLKETFRRLRKVIIYDDPGHAPSERLTGSGVALIIREFFPGITPERLAVLYYYVTRDLAGLGPLEALMLDPALEDISCNGGGLPVYVFHRNYGSLPTNIRFTGEELDLFVLKLAQKANKQVSLSAPLADATLPGGSRVQITFSNVVSLRGSSFTIRKFRAEPMTPLDLIRLGTYNAEILAFLWLAIEHRRSLIIAGGTASGKTTTMNAISLFIPLNAKIVSLEDTHEIQLPHSNWLANLTRETAAAGGEGNIDLFSLLKSSMRQRPEYIIVGEVRGREAQTLFQAMNTGHATLSTIHAGSVREAVNRLTHEPINVPPMMFSALDLLVTQSISSTGSGRIRRCLAVDEISVDDEGRIAPVRIFEWDVRSDTFRRVSPRSRVLDEIAATRGWSAEQVEAALLKREEFLTTALDVPVPGILDLAGAINDLG